MCFSVLICGCFNVLVWVYRLFLENEKWVMLFTDMTLQMICQAITKPMTLIQEPRIDFPSFDAVHLVCEINNNKGQINVLTDGIYTPLCVCRPSLLSLPWNFSHYFDLKPRSSYCITAAWVMLLKTVYSKALIGRKQRKMSMIEKGEVDTEIVTTNLKASVPSHLDLFFLSNHILRA